MFNNFIDTKIRAPYDVLPQHRTKLDKLNNKDPVQHENYGHVTILIYIITLNKET